MVPSELKLLKINDPDLICGTMKAIIFITDEHKDQESTVFLLLHHFKLCAFLLKVMIDIQIQKLIINVFTFFSF